MPERRRYLSTEPADIAVLAERINGNQELNRQRFDQADKAVAAALTAQEKATSAAFAAQQTATAAAFAAAKEAVSKAETAQEKVNAGQNEFRQTLKDQAGTFSTRNETDLLAKDLQSQLNEIKGTIDRGTGRGGGLTSAWGYLMAVAALVVAILANWKH